MIWTDVAVIGGGPGGIAAAVAAARGGADVVIVDCQGFSGGAMASGLPLQAFLDVQGHQVTSGIAQEIVDRLIRMGGCYGQRSCLFHNSTTVIQPHMAKMVAFQLIKEHGIRPVLHCELTDARVESGRLVSVTVTGKGNQVEIRAKTYIDTTVDGDLGHLSGARYGHDR